MFDRSKRLEGIKILYDGQPNLYFLSHLSQHLFHFCNVALITISRKSKLGYFDVP